MWVCCLECQLNSSQPIHIIWLFVEFDCCASCDPLTNRISSFYSQRCLNIWTLIFDFINKCIQFVFCFFWNTDSNIDCLCSEISSQNSSSILHCIIECFKINFSQIIRIARNHSCRGSVRKIISIEWKCCISRHYLCVFSFS